MHSRSLVLAAALLLTASVAGAAPLTDSSQAPASSRTIEVSRLGPQPGEKVPDFTLPDQDGRPRSLTSLMGEQGLVLVFSRSADW